MFYDDFFYIMCFIICFNFIFLLLVIMFLLSKAELRMSISRVLLAIILFIYLSNVVIECVLRSVVVLFIDKNQNLN